MDTPSWMGERNAFRLKYNFDSVSTNGERNSLVKLVKTEQLVLTPFTLHCALGAIWDLLYKSKTSGGKVMKFTPSYTFTKRNILVKKFWPLKARKAMLK